VAMAAWTRGTGRMGSVTVAGGDDLGFTYRTRCDGDVLILRHGAPVATIRGARARGFLARAEGADPAAVQQLMARMTGNYKRGTERTAGQHPRNRG
jgi:hypothetical protein